MWVYACVRAFGWWGADKFSLDIKNMRKLAYQEGRDHSRRLDWSRTERP